MTQQTIANTGILYVVPTPIGNLGDMVPRALEVLQSVDLVAAEDTRHSGKLLQHFNINTSMIAYHDHSDQGKEQHLLQQLLNGKNIALISDAGTPLISDPGYRLVSLARAAGVPVTPIPGACAAIAALSASGLPSDRFSFEGFLPAKTVARQKVLTGLSRDSRTLIFYESPHRILDALGDLRQVFGDERTVVMAREISKTFETFLFGSAAQLVEWVRADANQQRGEIVLIVQGYQPILDPDAISPEAEHLMSVLLDEGLALKQAAAVAARLSGEKKNRLYEWGVRSKADR